MTRRRNIFRGLLAMLAVALLAVPVALAVPNGPTAGQRIDMKVLLLSPTPPANGGEDSVYAA